MTSSTDVHSTISAPQRASVRRERLLGAGVFVAGIVVYFAITLLHHATSSSATGSPLSEVPAKTAFGAVGWILGFGLAMIAPHRARNTAKASRITAVVLVLVAVVSIPVFFWCSLPVLLAFAALLLARRASTLGAPVALDTVLTWLSVLAMVGSVATLLVYNASH